MRLLVTIGALVFCVVHVRAECITGLPKQNARLAEWVFEGTVLAMREEAAYQSVTIDVHWLWKGTVPRRATVYVVRNLESPRIDVGDRLVFVGSSHVDLDDAKRLPSPDNSPVMALLHCGGVMAADSRITNQLGRARRP
jgi:hypothetical protein